MWLILPPFVCLRHACIICTHAMYVYKPSLFWSVQCYGKPPLQFVVCHVHTHTRTLYAHVHNYCIVIMYLCLGAIWIKEVCFGRTNFYRRMGLLCPILTAPSSHQRSLCLYLTLKSLLTAPPTVIIRPFVHFMLL